MDIQLDIWLRGTNHATSDVISPVEREPRAWTDEDVRGGAGRHAARARPREESGDRYGDRPVALRGFSWIVNPFDDGGVVIALELSLGAVVAGPFDIGERDLQCDDRAGRRGGACGPAADGVEHGSLTDSPVCTWTAAFASRGCESGVGRKKSGRRGEAAGRSRARRLSELLV